MLKWNCTTIKVVHWCRIHHTFGHSCTPDYLRQPVQTRLVRDIKAKRQTIELLSWIGNYRSLCNKTEQAELLESC